MRGISSSLFMILVLGLSATIVKSQNFDTFIPRGYELLDSKSGDLNQDGIMDYVIICKNPKEDEEEDAKRPLMILHGNPNGSLTLIERNDNIVLCFLCGGVWGDPYEGMTLKKNFFSVEHRGGSNDRWTRIITFKYNTKDKSYYLHKDGGVLYNTFDPNKSTDEFYNKKLWGKMLFRDYVGE
jgi:hypothetical protein